MLSMRDPYPYPRVENDEDFVGSRYTQKQPYSEPSHLAQREGPWSRLSLTATLASSRKEAGYYDPQAPNDSLDFILKTEYNQHKEFLKDKNETLWQKETLGKPHNRILKNKTVNVPAERPILNHPLRVADSAKKPNPNSVKNAISGHHTQTTNSGYSRKPDGGLFTS